MLGCEGSSGDTGCELINWWMDADGDGFGSTSGKLSCEQPTGYVEASGDCDDTDPDVNPYGIEICNGLNDDCDWVTDEEPADGRRFYKDGDGDGYGNPNRWELACEPPSGFGTDSLDCDDRDAGVNPGETETCDNEIDDDCDGLVDDDDPEHTFYVDGDGDGLGDPRQPIEACEAPSGAVTNDDDCLDDDPTAHTPSWFPDADGDGYGAGDGVFACDAPSGHVATNDDCDDDAPAVHPDAAETCDGIDSDCDGQEVCGLADASTSEGPEGVGVGTALAASEVLAVASSGGSVWLLDEPGGSFDEELPGGAALHAIVLGDLDGDEFDDLVATSAANQQAFVVVGPLSSGMSLEPLDGPDDVSGPLSWAWERPVVGAPSYDEGRGRVLIWSGYDTLLASEGVYGEARGDAAGAALAAGDLDGDGLDELYIGAPGAGAGGTAYAWASGVAGTLTDADAALHGYEGAELGTELALGDLDGDGYGDLVIGGADTAWVHLGAPSGEATLLADVTVAGGASVGTIPDGDGDGRDELAVADPELDGGRVLVFHGPEGALGPDDAWLTLTAEADADALGTALVGWTEGLAVGAPGAGEGAGQVSWLTP